MVLLLSQNSFGFLHLKAIMTSPKIQIPNLAKAIKGEEEAQLAAFKPVQVPVGEDTGNSAHRMLSPEELAKAHITDKIFMFPESYNALRRELVYNFPTLWEVVGWNMAFKAEDFVAQMNDALDLKVQLDGNKIDATCKIFLDALRKKRGLKSVH
jgi:hypothetical protein